MSHTKTFEERLVGFSLENEKLFEIFNKLQTEHLGSDISFIFEFKNENVQNKADFGDGLKRFGNQCLNIKFSDRGQYVLMPAFSVQLNNQGYVYLEDFERDILAIEKRLGLEGTIDEDLAKKRLILQDEFALLINILTKTLAKCLEASGPVNNSARKYFAIFEGLLTQFINLDMAETNLLFQLFGANENSSSIIEIASKFEDWREQTLELMDSIYHLNITKNCIKQSIEEIEAAKLRLIQHLNYRLKDIHHQKIPNVNYKKLRAEESLYDIEKRVLLSSPESLPVRACAIFVLPLKEVKKLQEKRCYVYDGSTLYYINSKHKEMVITIKNQELFLQYVQSIMQETSDSQIISHNTGNNPTVSMEQIQQYIIEKDSHNIRLDFLTFDEKYKLICFILERKNEESIKRQLLWIRKLYIALGKVIWLEKNINYIDELTEKVGCLLFLYNFVDGNILNQYHESIIEEAKQACSDPLIKNTPLSLLGIKNKPHQSLQIKRCNFSELHGKEFQKYAYRIIKKNLDALEKKSQLNNGPRFFNIQALQHFKITPYTQSNSVLTIEDSPIHKEKTPELPQTHNQLLTNPQALALTFTNDSNTSDILVKPAQQSRPIIEENSLFFKVSTEGERNKETIFSILNMSRKDVVQLLQDYVAINEAFKELVTKECLEYFENNHLPQSWNDLWPKSASEIIKINDLSNKVDKLAKEVAINLLQVMCNEPNYRSLQNFNNHDLIQYIQKNNPKFLSHEQLVPLYQDYGSMRIVRLKVLSEFFSETHFLNAYLSYRYFEKKDGFTYIPNSPCVLASLFRKLNFPLQFWIETEEVQYKKLEAFNLHGNSSPVKNILFTDTNAQIGYASFQQLHCELLVHKQDKTFLKKLLVTAMSPTSRLTTAEKESILMYFCFNNESIADIGLKATLSNLQLARSQLRQIERKLNFEDLLIQEGAKFILKHIEQKLPKWLRQNQDMLIDESQIKRIKAQMEIRNIDYCAKKVNVTAENIKQSWNQQNLEMTLQWNNSTYRFESFPSPGNLESARDYHLYKIPPQGMFYALDPDNTHRAFFEQIIAGDGECGFTCLGLSRPEFVLVLLEAVKHPENRKILAKEMLNHLNSLYLEEESKWDKNLITDNIQAILVNKDSFTQQITIFIRKFSKLLGMSFSDYQPCIDHIKSDANLYNLHKDDVDQLQNLVDAYNRCDAAILTTCSVQHFCEYYVKQYHNTTLQLGKYAAQLYAKQKNISLYIYDKNICRIPFVLGFDKETSFIAKECSNPIRMVYVHGGHYNRLRLNTEYDNITPQKLWENYTDSLKTKIQL